MIKTTNQPLDLQSMELVLRRAFLLATRHLEGQEKNMNHDAPVTIAPSLQGLAQVSEAYLKVRAALAEEMTRTKDGRA